jgi:hypothetical protein
MGGRNLDSLAKRIANEVELSKNAHMHCKDTI